LSRIIVYIDGLCEPCNPGGVASYGFVIYRNSAISYKEAKVVGQGVGMSNNVAEYTALCRALSLLLHQNLHHEEIAVKSDSKLVVNQMSGWWNSHGGLYHEAYKQALSLAQCFSNISFEWIPRELNEEADGLSRQAYEEHCRVKGIEPKYQQLPVRPKEACLTCKWVRFSGPHIGCYKNYKYHGWLPKRFAAYNRCTNYEEVELSNTGEFSLQHEGKKKQVKT
jgi:ribonuclease HI